MANPVIVGGASVLALLLAKNFAEAKAQKEGSQKLRAEQKDLEAIILHFSTYYNIRSGLIWAVIEKESSFRPNLEGAAGELGLMQITSGAFTDFLKNNPSDRSYQNLRDPYTNIKIGTWYLYWLRKNWNLSERGMLIAYNGGIGNYLNFGGSRDAREYADIVLERSRVYA